MYVSHQSSTPAAYDNANAARAQSHPVSKEREAVEKQLAHNRAMSKANAEKLSKFSGSQTAAATTPKTSSTTAGDASKAAAAPSSAAAASTAKTTQSSETDKSAAASSGSATGGTRHSAVFEKQRSYNQQVAKLHAAMLSKFSATEKQPSAAATASASNAAADAATSKYMAHAASEATAAKTEIRV